MNKISIILINIVILLFIASCAKKVEKVDPFAEFKRLEKIADYNALIIASASYSAEEHKNAINQSKDKFAPKLAKSYLRHAQATGMLPDDPVKQQLMEKILMLRTKNAMEDSITHDSVKSDMVSYMRRSLAKEDINNVGNYFKSRSGKKYIKIFYNKNNEDKSLQDIEDILHGMMSEAEYIQFKEFTNSESYTNYTNFASNAKEGFRMEDRETVVGLIVTTYMNKADWDSEFKYWSRQFAAWDKIIAQQN